MSDILIRGYNRFLYLMQDSRALGAGATLQTPDSRVTGFRFVSVNFSASAGATAAAGFPRVRLSRDGGVTFDSIYVIPLDGTQATPIWTQVVTIFSPYISVEFKDGGGGIATLRSVVYCIPG